MLFFLDTEILICCYTSEWINMDLIKAIIKQ